MSRQGRAGFRGWSGKRGPPGSQAAAARARGRFAQFCGVLTLESFASSSLGLAVGSFMPSTDAALAIGPGIMVLFIVVRCPAQPGRALRRCGEEGACELVARTATRGPGSVAAASRLFSADHSGLCSVTWALPF